MKCILILSISALLFSCAASESKHEKLSKLNELIKIEMDYQDQLEKQLSSDSVRNARLFAEKRRSDAVEDSLWKEIKNIEGQ